MQVSKFSLLKITLSNRVKVITGSVIGNVELLHQGFTEFSPDLKLYKKTEESNGRVNASSALVSGIMSYKSKVKTFAMKHGLSMKQKDKTGYATISKKNVRI